MASVDIKRAARGSMIPLWKIARKLNVSEMTVTRWLREELPEDKRARIMDAIEQLKQEDAQ